MPIVVLTATALIILVVMWLIGIVVQRRLSGEKLRGVMDETRKNRKPMDDKTRAIYFGQSAATVRAHG